MSFPRPVRDNALSSCHRCCCICHKFCGSKMECHHIIQPKEGPDQSLDNCIPLCFDCHADVKAYNPDHPKGTSYSVSELKKHRDQWYSFCANNHVSREAAPSLPAMETALEKIEFRDGRLEARNVLIKFVDFCVKYPASHSRKSLGRTHKLGFELMQTKEAIEMLRPLSMSGFAGVYSSVITSAYGLQRLLDRQGGTDPKPIDERFGSVEDNIDGAAL